MTTPLRFQTIVLAAGLLVNSAFAQKGFDKKKKDSVPAVPRFSFTEAPIPRHAPTARKGLVLPGITGIKGLREAQERMRVIRDESNRVVWLDNPQPQAFRGQANSRVSASQAAFTFLDGVKDKLGLRNPRESFELTSLETDDLGQTHMRLKQVHRNIPVYGGEIVLHTVSDTLRLMNGRYFPDPENPAGSPSVNEKQALEYAFEDVAHHARVTAPESELSKMFMKSAHELVYYHADEGTGKARLAWHLTIHPNIIERWEYFVDAESGRILNKYNHTCGVDGPVTSKSKDLNNVERTFGSYRFGNTFIMLDASKPMFKRAVPDISGGSVGAIWTIDASNSYGDGLEVRQITSANPNSWNANAVSAHVNAGIAYDYYKKTFNRNSLNGKGGTIISVVNIADEEDGLGLDNAFWNGEFMGYGNGRIGFKPLAGGLDVAGHEMTHGVIQNSANLEYQGQSGAINESMADVFGVLIDDDDWTIGEDVVKPQTFPSGALRSMSNPNQNGSGQRGYQPKTMAQYVNTKEDNGGVHINSGIPNFAFYKIASQLGRKKSEQIYYRALTQYLTRRSLFLDLRLAVAQAATDLFGAGSTEVTSVNNAFDAVGITSGQTDPSPDPTNLPVNTGADGILVVGSADNVLYQTTPQAASFKERSRSGINHKASITDDGRFAYFVSDDKRIRAINLANSAQESVVSDETIWDNVAISRDGKKLAALTTDRDKSVYVYSFDLEKWKKFTLYNPTYSSGVTTGEVQYADAIVWDFSGEYLVYDANNKLGSFGGDDREYWDVGFLRVWDNETRNFGDGTIDKLFTDLEEGENIGNPAFSKNSSNIISFDYYYEPEETYAVLGVDIDRGKVNVITENNTLGFPDYSRKDDQLVFNTESSGKENVGIINLGRDRISASGNSAVFLQNGKWAVWFGQGTRQTNKQPQTIRFGTPADQVIGNPAFSLSATASSGLPVAFEGVSGGINVQGNQVTLQSAGKATVRALQPGNDKFDPAGAVDRTFCVNPARPRVTQNGTDYTASSLGADSYVWYDGDVEVPGVTSASVTIREPGNYQVRGITKDGCISLPFQITAGMVLGEEPAVSAAARPYPNPVKNELRLAGNWDKVPEDIVFVDVLGRVVAVKGAAAQNGTLVIPTTAISPGLYILKITAGAHHFTYRISKL